MADLDGDGIDDILSGSNCCEPFAFHWMRGLGPGSFGELQTVRFTRDDDLHKARFIMRGITRPRILDWNRDGRDDLIMGTDKVRVDRNLRSFDVHRWLEAVAKEEQAGIEHDYTTENNLRMSDVAIPELERLYKVDGLQHILVRVDDGFHVMRMSSFPHMVFADWDGDGNFDLLTIVRTDYWLRESEILYGRKREPRHTHAEERKPKSRHAIAWLRNKKSTGEPDFAAPKLLFQVFAPAELQSFTVLDWDDDGQQDIVVSVTQVDKENPRNVLPKELWWLGRP